MAESKKSPFKGTPLRDADDGERMTKAESMAIIEPVLQFMKRSGQQNFISAVEGKLENGGTIGMVMLVATMPVEAIPQYVHGMSRPFELFHRQALGEVQVRSAMLSESELAAAKELDRAKRAADAAAVPASKRN